MVLHDFGRGSHCAKLLRLLIHLLLQEKTTHLQCFESNSLLCFNFVYQLGYRRVIFYRWNFLWQKWLIRSRWYIQTWPLFVNFYWDLLYVFNDFNRELDLLASKQRIWILRSTPRLTLWNRGIWSRFKSICSENNQVSLLQYKLHFVGHGHYNCSSHSHAWVPSYPWLL